MDKSRMGFLLAAVWLAGAGPLGAFDEAKPADAGKAGGRLVPLNREGTVLLDKEGNRVLVQSQVVLREGTLEMLLCLKQTKEHESILSADTKAYVIHTGLLAIGARPGRPVRFVRQVTTPEGETRLVPDFQPPTGQRIDVYLQWTDEDGKLHRVPAQNWIRYAVNRFFVAELEELPADLTLPEDGELRWDDRVKELIWYGPMTADERDRLLKLSRNEAYRQAIRSFHDQSQSRKMDAHWVFAGSSFYVGKDAEGKSVRHYQAEDGDVICVANFPTAMLDVAMESTASGDENLLFEAWTEHVPPKGTKVTIELIPVEAKRDE